MNEGYYLYHILFADDETILIWWNKVAGMGKREKPREKPAQTPIPPPHEVTDANEGPQRWEARD